MTSREDNLEPKEAAPGRKEPPVEMEARTRNSRGIGVVPTLSLLASAIAVICFVTGRTTLSDFVSPRPVVPAAPTQTQTEQLFSQATFFVHYGHPPGQGADDYDSDDAEQDRQDLIAKLESYIASAPSGPPGKANAAGQKALAQAQSLLHALTEMKTGSPFKLPKTP